MSGTVDPSARTVALFLESLRREVGDLEPADARSLDAAITQTIGRIEDARGLPPEALAELRRLLPSIAPDTLVARLRSSADAEGICRALGFRGGLTEALARVGPGLLAAAGAAKPKPLDQMPRFQSTKTFNVLALRAGQGASSFGVFLGRDESGTTAALKHAPIGPATHESSAMSSYAASTCRHLVFARGLIPEGQSGWVVMGVGGTPLGTLHECQKRAPDLAAAMTVNLLRGLEALHQRGLLHRDVHPMNVLVQKEAATGEDDPQTIALCDFGQAVRIGPDGLWHGTNGGGNPEFMPPEQFEGAEAALDARSDLHAAAALCAYLIMGRPPFVPPPDLPDYGAPGWADKWAEVHRRGPNLEGIADPALRRVLERALAYDPADRYPDAASFIEALLPFAKGRPTSPPEPMSMRGRVLNEGMLAREQGTATVYRITGGAKLAIPSREAFEKAGLSWTSVEVFPKGSLSALRNEPLDGTLLRQDGHMTVYRMSGGRKMPIPNPTIFSDLGLDSGAITVVPDGALDRIKTGPIAVPEGGLVRQAGEQAVYVIRGGAKFWIPDPDAFSKMGFEISSIRDLPANSLDGVPTVPRDGSLIQEHGQPAVYVVDGGVRRWIQNEESFGRHGFRWEEIKVVPPGSIGQVPEGPAFPP